MAGEDFDSSQLSESQQEALGTYTAVTNQEPSAAVALLERSQWNVQVGDDIVNTSGSNAELCRLLLQNSSMAKPRIQSKKPELHLHLPLHHPYNHHGRRP